MLKRYEYTLLSNRLMEYIHNPGTIVLKKYAIFSKIPLYFFPYRDN